MEICQSGLLPQLFKILEQTNQDVLKETLRLLYSLSCEGRIHFRGT